MSRSLRRTVRLAAYSLQAEKASRQIRIDAPAVRRKDITELARDTWARIWFDPMPSDWHVYLVRKTFIQERWGRTVCGVTLPHIRTILVGRNTGYYNFRTLVHELAHLRTLDEGAGHGPRWNHEFNRVARQAFGPQLERNI
jgi:hypothetical protein